MILLTRWMYFCQLHRVCANIYLHAESWRETSPRQNWKGYIRGPVMRWLRRIRNVKVGIVVVLHFRDPLCPGDELLRVVPLCSEQHQPAESWNTSTSLMKTRSKPEFSWKINKPTSMTSSWPPNEVLITGGLAPLLYHNALSQRSRRWQHSAQNANPEELVQGQETSPKVKNRETFSIVSSTCCQRNVLSYCRLEEFGRNGIFFSPLMVDKYAAFLNLTSQFNREPLFSVGAATAIWKRAY